MGRAFLLAGWLLLGFTFSCSLLLDFDSLKNGGAGGSSVASGAAGAATGGIAGDGGQTGSGGTAAADAGDARSETGKGVALKDLAPILARAVCENLNVCYASASEILIHDENCEALFTSVLSGQVIAPVKESVARGIVVYDPVEAAACVAKLTEGTQKIPPQCSDFNAIVEDCKRMLSNLAGPGRACRHRYECQKGLLCDDAAGCPGTCKRFAAVGALCTVDGDCDPTLGLYCQKGDADGGGDGGPAGSCQPYVAINADCVQNRDQCAAGALCIDRKCRRVGELFTLAETFSCYSNGLLCQRGLYCEFNALPFLSMGTCVKEKRALDMCKLALPGECPKDTYCSANAFNGGGQCVASPVENQKCATDFEQTVGVAAPCKAGLTCVNGICKPARQLGEPCEVNTQCYSGACVSRLDAGPRVCVPAGCP